MESMYFVEHPIYANSDSYIKTLFDSFNEALEFAESESKISKDRIVRVLEPAVGQCREIFKYMNGARID